MPNESSTRVCNVPATYENISDPMRAIISPILELGLAVYMRHARDTWAHFTDGTRIGYVECNRTCGVSYSTVHIPSTNVGTGFSLRDDLRDATVAQCIAAAFAFAPLWARASDLRHVQKWASWNTFQESCMFNRAYRAIIKESEVA